MRVATWNVERPKPRGWKVAPAQRRRMAEVDADVWVLTETHVDHRPGPEFTAVFSPPYPERRPPAERWVGIWSRWPIEPLSPPVPNPRGSVAAILRGLEGPVVVYGCVIPWANERRFADGSPAGMWQVQLAEIERMGGEWRRLREEHPDVPLVVAGDFNQDRDGSGWYGTAEVRERLGEQLELAGLECDTAVDVAERGLLARHHLVDHICVSTGSWKDVEVRCWEPVDDVGTRLSDHPTVAVDLVSVSRPG